MTDRAEIETRVRKVLAEQLAVDEAQVVPDARFAEDLNADSLDLVEAVLALEEEWSIEIPEDEMEQSRPSAQPSTWWPRSSGCPSRDGHRPGTRWSERRRRHHRDRPGHPGRHRRRRLLGGAHVRPQRRPRDHPLRHRRPAGERGRRGARLRSPRDYLDTKEARRTDRFAQYAIAAGAARLGGRRHPGGRVRARRRDLRHRHRRDPDAAQQHQVLLEKGPGRVSPFMVPMLMANAAAGHIAMRFGLTGHNTARCRRAPRRTTRSARACA